MSELGKPLCKVTPMPEVTVYKDSYLLLREHHIRTTWKALNIYSEPQTKPPECSTKEELAPRVALPAR